MTARKLWYQIDQHGERWLLLVFYVMIVSTIFCEVVRRFVLEYSSIWGEEIARYSFIYLAWIGASAAVKERAHIRIDVIMHLLPNRAQALLYIFSDLLTLALALIAIYWSLHPVTVSWEFGSVTDGLRISKVWFLMAVPFGFALITLRLLQSLIRDWRDLLNNRPVYQGAQLFD